MTNLALEPLLARLATGPDTVRSALSGVSDEDARWRPPSGGWTLLEIVNHLAAEESKDFRTRLASTLDDPERPWPPIDPEGDIERLGYNERDLADSLGRFTIARVETIAWLRGLRDPAWDNAHEHPKAGALRAGDLLVSLCAHDALHLRQLAHRLFDLVQRDAGEYGTRYAGEW